MKTVKVNIDNGRLTYIDLLNGIFGFTPKEKEVLSAFIQAYKNIVEKNIDVHFLDTNVRKIVEKKLNLGNINLYIKNLREKKAFVIRQDKEVINELLLDSGEDEIVIKIIRGKKNAN